MGSNILTALAIERNYPTLYSKSFNFSNEQNNPLFTEDFVYYNGMILVYYLLLITIMRCVVVLNMERISSPLHSTNIKGISVTKNQNKQKTKLDSYKPQIMPTNSSSLAQVSWLQKLQILIKHCSP